MRSLSTTKQNSIKEPIHPTTTYNAQGSTIIKEDREDDMDNACSSKECGVPEEMSRMYHSKSMHNVVSSSRSGIWHEIGF